MRVEAELTRGLMIDVSGSSGVRAALGSRPICSEIAEDFKRVGDDFRAAIQTETGQPVMEVEADNQDQYLLSI